MTDMRRASHILKVLGRPSLRICLLEGWGIPTFLARQTHYHSGMVLLHSIAPRLQRGFFCGTDFSLCSFSI
jgi:hypothetical protein